MGLETGATPEQVKEAAHRHYIHASQRRSHPPDDDDWLDQTEEYRQGWIDYMALNARHLVPPGHQIVGPNADSQFDTTIDQSRFERLRRYIVTAEDWVNGDTALGPMLERLGVWADARGALQSGDLDDLVPVVPNTELKAAWNVIKNYLGNMSPADESITDSEDVIDSWIS